LDSKNETWYIRLKIIKNKKKINVFFLKKTCLKNKKHLALIHNKSDQMSPSHLPKQGVGVDIGAAFSSWLSVKHTD
jgi:hypothetical protein